MSARNVLVACGLGLGLLVMAGCQQGVARDEFDKLKDHDAKMLQENAQLKSEWEQMRAERDAKAAAVAGGPTTGPGIPSGEAPGMNPDVATIKNTALPPGCTIKTRNGNAVICIDGAMVNYGPGKASLTPDGKQAMDRIAVMLNRDFPTRVVVVEGHTDTDPIRRTANLYKNNWELGMKRSTEVVNYLELKGVDPKRIRATSYGEYQPVADNGSSSGKAKNRRVEIVVMAQDVASIPAVPTTPAAATAAATY